MDRQELKKKFAEHMDNEELSKEEQEILKQYFEKRYKEILKERRLKRGKNKSSENM
jgi:hypothetical protein